MPLPAAAAPPLSPTAEGPSGRPIATTPPFPAEVLLLLQRARCRALLPLLTLTLTPDLPAPGLTAPDLPDGQPTALSLGPVVLKFASVASPATNTAVAPALATAAAVAPVSIPSVVVRASYLTLSLCGSERDPYSSDGAEGGAGDAGRKREDGCHREGSNQTKLR
jgi:hypothetical protein